MANEMANDEIPDYPDYEELLDDSGAPDGESFRHALETDSDFLNRFQSGQPMGEWDH